MTAMMLDVLKYILLGAMVLLSIAAIQGVRLRRSVIYLGAFSLMSSLLYILYLAPDVAIAEAIIGCTISVILLLVAIKKYQVITIYYVSPESDDERPGESPEGAACMKMLSALDRYLIGFEFEPHLLSTTLNDSELNEKQDFDLLIVRHGCKVCMYSPAESYHTPLIRDFLKSAKQDGLAVEFIPMGEEAIYED